MRFEPFTYGIHTGQMLYASGSRELGGGRANLYQENRKHDTVHRRHIWGGSNWNGLSVLHKCPYLVESECLECVPIACAHTYCMCALLKGGSGWVGGYLSFSAKHHVMSGYLSGRCRRHVSFCG